MPSHGGTSYLVEEDDLCEMKTRLTAVLTDLELARRRLLGAADAAELFARRAEIAEIGDDALASAYELRALLRRSRKPARARARSRTMLRMVPGLPRVFRPAV